jgi:5-methylcytosine-specific restriction protein A
MALAPLRPCGSPRCPTLTRGGRCAAHQKAKQQTADQQRGTAQERGYDSRWAAFSKTWRETYPVCGMRSDGKFYPEHSQCLQQGKLTTSDLCVDHIKPLADAAGNLQTLCRACNTRKDTGWSADRRSA